MAKNVIKGLTVEIGGDTTELGKALASVEAKSKSLSGELRDINKLLKMDPGNAELLAQKQQVLSEAVESTAEKLKTLQEAEKQVQEQFKKGEVSEEQVRQLQREIIATEKKLKDYEQAAKETAEEVKKLGAKSDDAADDIADVDKQSDKASDSLEDMGKEARDAGESSDRLDADLVGLAKGGLAVAVAGATALIGALVATTESTQEYRTEMGKLKTAYEAAGHSTETATRTYKELQSVIGETDQAVEAAQQIALLAESEEDAAKWASYAAGVVGRFGDALQPETFFEAANETLKLGEATGAYTQMLEGCGVSVDKFNMELAQCTTVGEKQKYMLRVTDRLLGDAAETYRRTNSEIIRSNRASEEWNATLADIGAEMQPVMTDFKEFGTEILQDSKGALEKVSRVVRDEVIPALKNIYNWVKDNGPTVKGFIVAAATAIAAYEVAVIATTVSQKGLVGAIKSTTVAQTALNLVQKATPWGLVAAGVAAAVAGIIAYGQETANAKLGTQALTDEEQKLIEKANETAKAFRETKAAAEEESASITAQMGHVQDLANELKTLVGEKGEVQKTDESRVQFILNELNEALGTEYSMVNGIVQEYGNLKKSIDDVIQSKLANSLLEANNQAYIDAINAEDEALEALGLAKKDYEAQLAHVGEKEDEYAAARAERDELMRKNVNALSYDEKQRLFELNNTVLGLGLALDEEKNILDEKKEKYDESAAHYGQYHNTVLDYEEAQQAALEGNYGRTVELLKKKGGQYDAYADNVDDATREAIDALYKEAIDAGVEAARTKKNFEKGIDGYTEEMVKEAEQGYENALNAWATAKTDAEGVGEDLSSGLSGGMENKRSSLIAKAKSIVSSIIQAFKDEADSNSPSKKMIDFGEDMGEGGAIGLENKTKRWTGVAREQVKGLMDTYATEGDISGQEVFNALGQQTTARQEAALSQTANGTTGLLNKILTAIERGQVIMLDGKTLVGETANGMDTALGQRRVLAARGAI